MYQQPDTLDCLNGHPLSVEHDLTAEQIETFCLLLCSGWGNPPILSTKDEEEEVKAIWATPLVWSTITINPMGDVLWSYENFQTGDFIHTCSWRPLVEVQERALKMLRVQYGN